MESKVKWFNNEKEIDFIEYVKEKEILFMREDMKKPQKKHLGNILTDAL